MTERVRSRLSRAGRKANGVDESELAVVSLRDEAVVEESVLVRDGGVCGGVSGRLSEAV